jgi:hypothetical protein
MSNRALDRGLEGELGKDIIATLEGCGYTPEEIVPAITYALRHYMALCPSDVVDEVIELVEA